MYIRIYSSRKIYSMISIFAIVTIHKGKTKKVGNYISKKIGRKKLRPNAAIINPCNVYEKLRLQFLARKQGQSEIDECFFSTTRKQRWQQERSF